MDKGKKLQEISNEIKRCQACQVGKSGVAVPGEGDPNAKIIFMGEAPGKQEALSGRPFIGRSGQLLRKLISKVGLNENQVFITSPVKYLPDRGTPTKSDIEHGMIHTQKQIDIIKPKLIVLLGSVAAQGVLGQKISVTKDHGGLIKKMGSVYFPTIHPAATLRFPPLGKILEEDFQKLKKIVNQL